MTVPSPAADMFLARVNDAERGRAVSGSGLAPDAAIATAFELEQLGLVERVRGGRIETTAAGRERAEVLRRRP